MTLADEDVWYYEMLVVTSQQSNESIDVFCLVEILRLKFGRDSEGDFDQDSGAKF